MRSIAIAVSIFSLALCHESASAQSFWYVPQGYGYGYYQDFGNGVGFGYGIGGGVPFTFEQVTTPSTPNLQQSVYDSGESVASNGNDAVPASTLHAKKAKAKSKTKAAVVKKQGTSLPIVKGVKTNPPHEKNSK